MFLILLLVYCLSNAHADTNSFGYNKFYYKSLEFDQKSFYTNRLFSAMFTSTATTTTWSNPSGNCLMKASSGSSFATTTLANVPVGDTISFNCTKAGQEMISVFPDALSTNADTIYVTITNPSCYRWYMIASHQFVSNGAINATASTLLNQVSPSSTFIARLWIMDPSAATANELSAIAIAPSTSSIQLTQGFHALGESPTFVMNGNNTMIVNGISFVSSSGFWEVSLTDKKSGSHPMVIQGSNTIMMDCGIENIEPLIYVLNYDLTAFGLSNAVAGSSSSTYFKLYKDVCYSSAFLGVSSLFGDGRLAFSQSDFQFDPSSLSSSSLIGSSIIYGIAPTISGISILTSTGLFFGSSSVALASISSPSNSLDRIKSADHCDSSNSFDSVMNSVVVVWNSNLRSSLSTQTHTLYVSKDGGSTFSSVNVNVISGSSTLNGYIRDVAIQSSLNSLSILIRDASGIDRISLYNLTSLAFTSGYSFTVASGLIVDAGVKNSNPGIVALPMGELIAYGDSVYYSPNGGVNMFTITLSSRDPLRPAPSLATSEYVTQVTIGTEGYFAVLTSANRIFYGQTGLSYAIELTAGILSNELVYLSFDSRNLLKVYTSSAASPFVSSRIIPTLNQILSPRPPIELNSAYTCPYYSFESNATVEYFLDSKDSIIIQASLIPKTTISNMIGLTFTDESLLNYTLTLSNVKSTDEADGSLLLKQNATIQIQPLNNRVSGKAELQIQPQKMNLACQNGKKIATVELGCPTQKAVFRVAPTVFVPDPFPTPRYDWNAKFTTDSLGRVVLGKKTYTTTTTKVTSTPTMDTTVCGGAPASVTLSSGSWISDWTLMSSGSSSKVIEYDCAKYGNPITVYYGTPLVPTIALYNWNIFNEYVDADIAIWEEYGQTGYTFNTTMGQAGCIQKAQTLSSLIDSNSNTPSSAWAPSNYQKCYSGSSYSLSSSDSNLVYPITNRTNSNALKWTDGKNGFYFFAARVVDAEYSYCTLTAYFAVSVYGAPLSAGIQAAIVIGTMAFILALLIMSFFWRKQLVLKEKEELLKEKED